jgi:hypothetical protein
MGMPRGKTRKEERKSCGGIITWEKIRDLRKETRKGRRRRMFRKKRTYTQ